MSQCSKLQDYLARLLEGAELEQFEQHIVECEKCLEAIEDVAGIDAQVDDWIGSLETPVVSDSQKSQLVNLANGERSQGVRWKIIVPFAAAACIAVALGTIAINWNSQTDPDPTPQPVVETLNAKILLNDGGRIDPATAQHGEILEVPGKGKLQMMAGDDRIGVASKSRIEIVRIGRNNARFKLLKGTINVEAEHRSGDETLRVEAGKYIVEVVGTRFEVDLLPNDGIEVSVSEGEVAVLEPGGFKHSVVAGQVLALGTTPEETIPLVGNVDAGAIAAKTTKPKPSASSVQASAFSYDATRKLIIEGKYDQALPVLDTHLGQKPGDAQAWQMMADCKRKTHKWGEAVDAYNKVIKSGNPKTSNRARFKAAVLLQDNLGRHGEAATLLKAYRKRNKPLKPLESEAMFREADSLLKLGRNKEATKLLEALEDQHAGTAAAIKARKILKTLQSQ